MPDLTDELRLASQRLVRTVDTLQDDDWQAPCLLPAWTRAHLVAHLALNAEALAGVLHGIEEGQAVPMYPSQEHRDADIEDLAQRSPTVLRDRLLAGITGLAQTIDALPPDRVDTTWERTPGGRRFRAGAVPGMRLREVEIHHADLGCGYTHHDWTEDFAVHVLDTRSQRAGVDTGGCTAYATDLDRAWSVGTGEGPRVSGPVRALAWWVTGRDAGEELASDGGVLPRAEAW